MSAVLSKAPPFFDTDKKDTATERSQGVLENKSLAETADAVSKDAAPTPAEALSKTDMRVAPISSADPIIVETEGHVNTDGHEQYFAFCSDGREGKIVAKLWQNHTLYARVGRELPISAVPYIVTVSAARRFAEHASLLLLLPVTML